MSTDVIRLLLTFAGAYMVYKSLSAPKRGTFLTLFGNVTRYGQPFAFIVCVVAGWVLAVAMLFAAVFTDQWLPVLARLQIT